MSSNGTATEATPAPLSFLPGELMKPAPLPWPFFVCMGIVGGAIGTVCLSYLVAATKIDEWLNGRR